jgi:hypothetical protein
MRFHERQQVHDLDIIGERSPKRRVRKRIDRQDGQSLPHGELDELIGASPGESID